MDGHRSDLVGAQNSAYRFARPKILAGPICGKGQGWEPSLDQRVIQGKSKGEDGIRAGVNKFVKRESLA